MTGIKDKIGVPLPPEIVSLFNEDRERCLKAEDISANLACQAKSSMERKNFTIVHFKINISVLKAENNRSTHKMFSQKDKQANAGKSTALYGKPSYMSDQEELECLHPTVKNINEWNKMSIFKVNTVGASEPEIWIEKLQAKDLKW